MGEKKEAAAKPAETTPTPAEAAPAAPALVQKKSKGDEDAVKVEKVNKQEDHKNDVYDAFSGHLKLDGK